MSAVGEQDEEVLPLYGPVCDNDCVCFAVSRVEAEKESQYGSTSMPLFRRLNVLDRFLTVWTLVSMAAGLLVGYYAPWVGDSLRTVTVGSVSLPVALGLIVMLLPVFCKVPYETLRDVARETGLVRQLGFSFALNWLVGPLLMTALAWATLPDLVHYRNGVILVGLARCIAMVLLWNSLAKGSAEYCAILVAFNACLQILLYAPMAVFYIDVVSSGGGDVSAAVFFWDVVQGVLIFMGIPFALGVLIRYTLRTLAGKVWFDNTFVPRFSPLALIGLLYTVFVLFAAQGHNVIAQVGPVARVAVPLLFYFAIMYSLTLFFAYRSGFPYKLAITQALTASSNNFELAIAIAVATFGVTSPEALAAIVGPLVEVPVLLGLVSLASHFQPWWASRIQEGSMEML